MDFKTKQSVAKIISKFQSDTNTNIVSFDTHFWFNERFSSDN